MEGEQTTVEQGQKEVEIDVFNTSGEKVDKIKVPAEFFKEPNRWVLWYYVKWYLAEQRAGTVDTKTRSTIRGGGRKPWPQKHTGRARQGSIRAPHWRHGAVAHGPHPRDWSYKLNKKEKREALRSAIADKFLSGKLKVVDEIKLPEIKTKLALQVLSNLETYPVTVVTDDVKRDVYLSFRNIPYVDVKPVQELNAYQVLLREWLLIEKNAFLKIIERWKNGIYRK